MSKRDLVSGFFRSARDKVKRKVLTAAEGMELMARDVAEIELEKRGMLKGAPRVCGNCRYMVFSRKHNYNHCSHPGGPDPLGFIGFVNSNAEPRPWCPRLNGIWEFGIFQVPREWVANKPGAKVEFASKRMQEKGLVPQTEVEAEPAEAPVDSGLVVEEPVTEKIEKKEPAADKN